MNKNKIYILIPGVQKSVFRKFPPKKQILTKKLREKITNTEDQSAGLEPDLAPRETEVMEGSRKLST